MIILWSLMQNAHIQRQSVLLVRRVLSPHRGIVSTSSVKPRVSFMHSHMFLKGVSCFVHLSTMITGVVNIFEMLGLENK